MESDQPTLNVQDVLARSLHGRSDDSLTGSHVSRLCHFCIVVKEEQVIVFR